MKIGRREFIRSALSVAVASALALSPFDGIARNPRGAALPRNQISNLMGINFSNQGDAGFNQGGLATWKNRIRECSGFYAMPLGAYGTRVALQSNGWPAADFQVNLFTNNGNTNIPAWAANGQVFSCGFIGTGAETITAANQCTVGSIVHRSGGAYTTFSLTVTGQNFGFGVTGTTGGATQVFAYLQAYAASTIDNPLSATAFTNEGIAFWSQWSHIRFMEPANALWNAQMGGSANRRTASNSQAPRGIGNFNTVTLASTPSNATSVVIANWPEPAGTYALSFNGGELNANMRICTIGGTGANVTATWTGPISITSTSVTYGLEDLPFEWFLALCNTCGVGAWINIPMMEDGSMFAAGSYSTALLQYLDANWTSPGKVYIETGNENWANSGNSNLTGIITGALYNLFVSGASSYSNSALPSYGAYLGYRWRTFANLARATLSRLTFGNQVNQVFGAQAGDANGTNVPVALAYMQSTYGNVAGDVQYLAIAPYLDAVVGNSDSILTIETSFQTAGQTSAHSPNNADKYNILARHYGLKLCAYEGGPDTGAGYGNNNNVSLAIMDFGAGGGLTGGWKTAITPHYNACYNAGFDFFTQFDSAVVNYIGGNSPGFGITNNYNLLVGGQGSPVENACAQYWNGFTVTRNVVSGSGATVPGYAYADNLNTTNPAFNINDLDLAVGGFCLPYSIYSPIAQSLTLSVYLTTTQTGTMALRCNGTTVNSGQAISSGLSNSAVPLGTVSLNAGWNAISLSIGAGAASGITANQLKFV